MLPERADWYAEHGLSMNPLIVPECGHFLQWERVDVLNEVAKAYFADLRTPHR
ncbi:MAG: hypothetical protein JRH10_07330 [Deltaproteobacteria bacterium]|nr:hypothetical protein [Deltaproteobacteria bacterium]MBW2447030.1 hypothetical protein [Deltaproteobacteria bacterium]